MANSRSDIINAIMHDRSNMVKDMQDSALKSFIRRNINNFIQDKASKSQLYKALRDPDTTANEALEQAGFSHVRIITAKVSQAFDMMYNPASSVLYKQFLQTVANNAGHATVICVLGKRAVVLSNVSAIALSVDYFATKKQAGALPDLVLVPWQQIAKFGTIVTQ